MEDTELEVRLADPEASRLFIKELAKITYSWLYLVRIVWSGWNSFSVQMIMWLLKNAIFVLNGKWKHTVPKQVGQYAQVCIPKPIQAVSSKNHENIRYYTCVKSSLPIRSSSSCALLATSTLKQSQIQKHGRSLDTSMKSPECIEPTWELAFRSWLPKTD
jgi:hypothetical protein